MNQEGQHRKKKANEKVKKSKDSFLNTHIHFECIDSTNTWAKQNVEQWSTKGLTLITASEQSQGRGRLKRQWISPPHVNIYATFCFWLDLERLDIGHIPQLLALTVVQTLKRQGFCPTIKWPNDVLLNEKKIAGILCETLIYEQQRGIICGLGLNVNMQADFLKQIDRPATSLFIETGKIFEIHSLLNPLVCLFSNSLQFFLSNGFSSFFPSFQKYLFLKKGQFVRFHDHCILIDAQFEKLHPNGSIELCLSNGTFKIFHSGEFLS